MLKRIDLRQVAKTVVKPNVNDTLTFAELANILTEDERAFVQTRMRDYKRGRVDDKVVKEQNIQVNQAWAILDAGFAPENLLQSFQMFQQ